MIIGIGIDLVQIDKIEKSLQNERFLNKIYTSNEQHLYHLRNDNPQVLAGNFAAKEAAMKAMSVGMDKIGFADIEVLREQSGKPYINLYGRALELYNKLQCVNIFVSISNTQQHAVAQVIIER